MEGSARWSHWQYDEQEEFARSVRVSLLGVTPEGMASFRPSPESLIGDWETWSETIFASTIGPFFRDSFELGSEFHLQELALLDATLGKEIPELSSDLMAASLPFIEGKTKIKGHPELGKYTRKIESGKAPGHLPVIFALHSVLYRLPLAGALFAYAWFEWMRGHELIGKSSLAGTPESPPNSFLIVKPHIAELLRPDPGSAGLHAL